MNRYETLFLTVPEITQDESNSLEKELDNLITSSKGSILSYERWGKYQLAYPIRNYEYGVYFLMRFEIKDENKTEVLKELKNFFQVKQADLIMRHLVARLDPNASLEYKRLDSLEEMPSLDVDTFVKEKMTGILDGESKEKESTSEKFEINKLQNENAV